MRAHRDLSESTRTMESSSSKLASGSRINSAKDDAAGLAISNNLKAQVMGLRQAQRNANDSISYLQVAEGSMNEQSSIITRMRELAMRSASDTISDAERDLVEHEYREMADEMQRIAESTKYNGQDLLSLSESNMTFKDFQIGIHDDENSRLTLQPLEFTTDEESLEINVTSVWSKEDAQQSLSMLDQAQQEISSQRSLVGSYQSRLQSTINNLEEHSFNSSGANSRIRDVDYAQEKAENIRAEMKMKASSTVMVQANNFSASALKLLKTHL